MNLSSDSGQTEALLKGVGDGDRHALNRLLDEHRPFLHRVIDVRMEPSLRQRVDASDVIQETMIVANRNTDDFLQRRPTSFRLWLRRKALERLIDIRREHHAQRRSVEREMAISDASSLAIAGGLLAGRASETLRRKELAGQVRKALLELSEADREVLILRHVEQLTNSEVAELLNLKAVTASKRYGRALRRLSAQLAELGFSQS